MPYCLRFCIAPARQTQGRYAFAGLKKSRAWKRTLCNDNSARAGARLCGLHGVPPCYVFLQARAGLSNWGTAYRAFTRARRFESIQGMRIPKNRQSYGKYHAGFCGRRFLLSFRRPRGRDKCRAACPYADYFTDISLVNFFSSLKCLYDESIFSPK